MFQINAHVIPGEDTENHEKYKGAYAVLYIDYADIDGAYELAKHYIIENGWKIQEIETEYFIIDSESDVESDQVKYYHEAIKYGYSLVFNCYETEDDN